MTPSNQLFNVHVWAEEIGDGQVEWRGRINSLPDGSIAYFRTWDDLVKHMQQQLGELPRQADTKKESHDET